MTLAAYLGIEEDVRCARCDEPAHWERQMRHGVRVCDACNQVETECWCLDTEEDA